MLRLRLVVSLAIVSLAVVGAAAQKISTEFDETTDFARFKTFAIRDGQVNSRNPILNSELTRKRIETEIERALMAKGLTRATGPADLNVFYHFGTKPKVESEAYPAGWRGLGTRVVRVPYNEGTLVLDVRNTATRSLVWRGVATDEERDPMKIAKKLDDMVKKAFAKYPPKK